MFYIYKKYFTYKGELIMLILILIKIIAIIGIIINAQKFINYKQHDEKYQEKLNILPDYNKFINVFSILKICVIISIIIHIGYYLFIAGYYLFITLLLERNIMIINVLLALLVSLNIIFIIFKELNELKNYENIINDKKIIDKPMLYKASYITNILFDIITIVYL